MQLQAYRDFTARLRANLEADERVLAFIAMGSMAETSRLPDDWSDHDFFVITTTGHQEWFRQHLDWLPDPDRMVLSIRETTHGLKVLYDYGHLLEFAVFDREELATARANDYRIVFDRVGISVPQTEPPSESEYDPTRDWQMVIALAFVGVGRYARGEHISAHAFVKNHLLHHLLPLLCHTLPGADKSGLDSLDSFRRFEQVFPTVGAEINRLLLQPVPAAALGFLDVLERHIAPLPQAALKTVRAYIHAATRRAKLRIGDCDGDGISSN